VFFVNLSVQNMFGSVVTKMLEYELPCAIGLKCKCDRGAAAVMRLREASGGELRYSRPATAAKRPTSGYQADFDEPSKFPVTREISYALITAVAPGSTACRSRLEPPKSSTPQR
jgi:hypothetical protein